MSDCLQMVLPSNARSAGLARTTQFRSLGHGTAGSKRTIEVVTHHVRPGTGAPVSSELLHHQSRGGMPSTEALLPGLKLEPRAMTARLKTIVTASVPATDPASGVMIRSCFKGSVRVSALRSCAALCSHAHPHPHACTLNRHAHTAKQKAKLEGYLDDACRGVGCVAWHVAGA